MLSPDPPSLCEILGQLIVKGFVAETETEIYQTVAKHLPLLIPADRVSITLLTSSGLEMEVFVQEGVQGDLQVGSKIPCTGQTLAGTSVLTQHPQLIKVSHDSPYLDTIRLAKEGLGQVMSAPLSISEQVLGSVNIASYQNDLYGAEEICLLTQIAALISANIERLRLIRKTQTAIERHRNYAERLEILNEMGRRLSSAMTEEEVFNVIAEAIEHVLNAERISYVIPNPDGCSCQIFALRGNDIIPKAQAFPLKGSGIEAVLKRGKPTAFPDLTSSNYREHSMLVSQGLLMGWSVPIQVSGELVGILNAATSTQWPFPQEALTLLSALGRFMGTTIERINAHNVVNATLQKLEHQVSHDSLTGLPNRNQFEQTLIKEIEQHDVQQGRLAVLFIDLDGFKGINDSLSHSIGDRLLCTVAKRLHQKLRPQDMVARMGGDEFVVFLKGIHHPDLPLQCAERLIEALSEPFAIDEHHIQIGGSIGISLFPEQGQTVDELMKHADIAMYAAKSKGRNNYQIYSEEMSQQLQLRLNLERDLRQAIAQNEFFLMFQPQFELTTGQVSALEALIRWNHPKQGILSPGSFIPVAEDVGLISDISAWVLDHSLQFIASLHAQHPYLYVSVNISAQEFLRPATLTHHIQQALDKYQLPGHVLELELTETVFLEHATTASDVIKTLKQEGIRLAIDDFGTGFSSLNYLLNLPMDTLKIDRAFIQSIHTDSRKKGIVKTILSLGENLEVNCVAEGVEELEQLRCLQTLGCPKLQGFLLAKPMVADQLSLLLDQGPLDTLMKSLETCSASQIPFSDR